MAARAHAKGTAILQCVKALRAMPDQARAVLPEHLHPYLTARVLVSSWYPEEDYIALLTALTQILPAPPGVDVWELCGTTSARHDLSTVYRGLVRGGDLLTATKAAQSLFQLYHDTGRVELSGDGGRITLDVFDYATVSAPHCRFITSYMRELIRIALGRDVVVTETLCRASGQDRCRRELLA